MEKSKDIFSKIEDPPGNASWMYNCGYQRGISAARQELRSNLMNGRKKSKYAGMKKQAALDSIKKDGFIHRIMAEDGNSFVGTCDLRMDRINLSIKDGIVKEAYVG